MSIKTQTKRPIVKIDITVNLTDEVILLCTPDDLHEKLARALHNLLTDFAVTANKNEVAHALANGLLTRDTDVNKPFDIPVFVGDCRINLQIA